MGKINHDLAKDLKPHQVELKSQTFWLDPLCAAYWEERDMLLISDLHIGKAGHFRKAGFPVPEMIGKKNLWNLSLLLDRYNPAEVCLLGDLFHSYKNHEWDEFIDLRNVYSAQRWILVVGNHDILDQRLYEEASLEFKESWNCDPFHMVHEPLEEPVDYTLCGHIHPCVRLSGRANQSLRLPCFWISEKQMVFPAFGDFTGMHKIRPSRQDRVYVVTGKEVVRV